MNERTNILLITIAVITLAGALSLGMGGCGQDAGPDSISSHGDLGGGSGEFPVDCEVCHLGSDTLGPNPLITNGSGTQGKHIVHYTDRGFDCEKCHLGYLKADTHINGVIDTGNPSVDIVFFDATNPAGRWVNDTGPGTGSCTSMDCHGPDTVEWYGTAGWTLPACTVCHSEARGTRRPVTGAQGDFGTNPSILSHHVAGSTDPTDAQCTVCHDISRHMIGEIRLIDADTSAVITYDPTAPAGMEPFCLSCHDSDGAGGDTSPFADGQMLGVAPYRMSGEIETHWNKAYGHQQQGLTCLGNGSPDTGCHAGGHGSAYVGILSGKLTLPNLIPPPYNAAHEGDYELCFSCHANYPRVTKEAILGVMQFGNYDIDHGGAGTPPYHIPAIQTKFRDRYDNSGQFYDDSQGWRSPGEYWNLHFMHLQLQWGWNYRDIPDSSYVHCLSCHNVHGSDTQWGWLYDEMGFNHFSGVGNDEYGAINDIAAMSNYPIGCTLNCHEIVATYMWFQPPNE